MRVLKLRPDGKYADGTLTLEIILIDGKEHYVLRERGNLLDTEWPENLDHMLAFHYLTKED